jgi:hypothetical protein
MLGSVRISVTATLMVLLAACGGGGGGSAGTSNSAQVGPPVATYDAFAADLVADGTLSLDAQGRVAADGEVYELKDTVAAPGCTFGSVPASTPIACNRLPSDSGYLLCDTASGEAFGLAVFKSGVVATTPAEIGTATLAAFSCGVQDPRNVDGTVKFDSIGLHDLTSIPGDGSIISGPALREVISATGSNYFDRYRIRYVLRKKVSGNTTTFFVLRLIESTSATADKQPKIFTVTVTQ